MNDWREFKKTFTQEQEDAIWQYFIDHSKLQPNGYWGIMFYIKDVDDFWRRLHARYTGDFTRYDKLEKKNKQDETAFNIMKWHARHMSKRTDQIRESGTYLEKVMLWSYQRLRDKLFKKI